MKEERLLRAFGRIDESFVEEAAATIGAGKMEKTVRAGRKLGIVLLAAVIAVFLMGAGVVAVIYGGSIQSWFEHNWEIFTGRDMTEGQTAVIDHLSQDIGLSQTVDGVTVTVDSATVGDDNFYVLLRVEGLKFNERYSYDFKELDVEVTPDPIEVAGGIGSFGMRNHGIDGDGAALMLMDYDYNTHGEADEAAMPLEIALTLKDIVRGLGSDREKVVAAGNWSFEFTIDRKDIESLRLPDTEVTLLDLDTGEETTATLTDIELTNVGIKFRYDYQHGRFSAIDRVEVILKNGASVMCSSGSGVPLEDKTTLKCSYKWMFPIDLNEVDIIRIDDAEIQVN